MKKRSIFLSLLALVLVISLVGCGKDENKITTLSFPADDYHDHPFVLSFQLPEGWSVEKNKSSEDYRLLSVFSKSNLLNGEGACVGVVGYNTYELYEGAEDDPRAIYNQIALGNDYQFNVRDSYEIIKESEQGVTALVDVYYSASINDGQEKHNRGIVSYNKELLVYVAFEFDEESVTNEEISTIAQSVTIEAEK